MISKETISDLLSATRIEDVIMLDVKLKKAGAVYKGNCPFHNEKTPSFVVSPAKGTWHCYGCHEGGDAIAFLRKFHNLEFIDAVKKLASFNNFTITEVKADPEAEKNTKLREELYKLNEFALKYYQDQLLQNKDALDYISSRLSIENISLWRIGFAPSGWNSFFDHARKAGYREEFLIDAGLARRSEKKNSVYDFFRNRIMFPVFNRSGRVSGFSARIFKPEEETAKYINSPDTLVYSKSKELYGIHLAARSISIDGSILVEGNTDVIRMHEVGASQTVAPSGTSVTDEQLKTLRRLSRTITIITDGDNAGQKSMMRTGRLALENDFQVYCAILPEKEDPDTFFKTEEQYKEWISKNRQNFIIMLAGKHLSNVGQDPAKKNEAVKEICEHLKRLDEVSRALYIDQISTTYKIKAKLFTDRLKDLELINVQYEADDSLPEGVDARDFERWGFYEHKNCYFMRTKSGIEEVSNFVMKPLFHIEGSDSRRAYELINFRGYRIVVDLDMQEMTSIQAFRRNIEGRGNFIFSGNDSQFTRIKSKLYEETRTCTLIKVLGWQKEGFWAWSNGITTNDAFTEIDEYGVVTFQKNNYFIPAFSSIYIDNKAVFLSERKFKFSERKISMLEWTELFYDVFGDNARIGVCFWVASVFRDFVLYLNNNFPILNLFGPKGTGKSQMAMSLSCLFGEQQIPFNIHNGTKAGLAEHLQQFSNAFAWVDEYKNNLDYDKIETLKSVYDAIGRNRLNEKLQKQTTLVNSAMILSGQEMPTADVALFSRLIFCQFHKTEYTDQEKKLYDKLKNMERQGLSHLSAMLIPFRTHFEKEFYNNIDTVISDIFDELKDEAIEDRILRSWCTIAAALRTIQNKVNFGFGYQDVRPVIIRGIREQNSQVSKSNEIGQFWDMLEAMFDRDALIEGWHFRLTLMDRIKTTTGERTFKEAKSVLRFKFSSIAMLYAENARKSGLKPLPADTLSYYLKNSKPFLGIQPSVKFTQKAYNSAEQKIIESKTVTSAFCFDYSRIGINLTRGAVGDILPEEKDNDEPDSMLKFNDRKNGSAFQVTDQTALELQTPNTLSEKDLPF